MSRPLISIIVPIYNVELYLQRCLDSIVNQSYTNLEIILVNDGSQDNCPQICDEYAAKDNRIVVIHKENGGLSDARNAGLEICRGEYISFVDSDDWINNEYIENLIRPTQDETYDFIISDYSVSTNKATPPHLFCKEGPILGNTAIVSTYCQQKYPPSAWAKLYNHSFIEKNHFRFHRGLLFEDQLWSCSLASSATRIYIIHKPSYHYTIRVNSIMQSNEIDFAKRLSSWCFILASEQQILTKYQKILKEDLNHFFLNKIAEALMISNWDRTLFNKAFQSIAKAIKKPPISFWFKDATGLMKISFFLFFLAPSTFEQSFLYYHLRKTCKHP